MSASAARTLEGRAALNQERFHEECPRWQISLGNDLPFVLIAGPCQIEVAGARARSGAALAEITRAAGVALIYKTSFDKANRTSAAAARGIGMARGSAILADVRERPACRC